jgi:hypothetical protein
VRQPLESAGPLVLEIRLRVFFAQDRKYLLAVVTPVFFKVGKKGGRQ